MFSATILVTERRSNLIFLKKDMALVANYSRCFASTLENSQAGEVYLDKRNLSIEFED